jgi:hypothetical protein
VISVVTKDSYLTPRRPNPPQTGMQTTTRTIMLLLALLLGWGQSLAAVLVDCHGADRSAVHAAHSVHAGPASHAGHGAASDPAPVDQLKASLLQATDCASSCALCRSLSLAEKLVPSRTGQPLLLLWNGPVPDLQLLAPPPASHFRPPNQHALS